MPNYTRNECIFYVLGKVITDMNCDSRVFCITPHPSDDNIVVAGCGNKKALQWDTNTGTVGSEFSTPFECIFFRLFKSTMST